MRVWNTAQILLGTIQPCLSLATLLEPEIQSQTHYLFELKTLLTGGLLPEDSIVLSDDFCHSALPGQILQKQEKKF